MKLKVVKKDEKLDFHGVEIEREYRDQNLYAVKVKFVDGTFFTVARHGWSDLEIMVKEPPKMVKKYVVTGIEGGKPFTAKFLTWESAHAISSASHVADGAITEIEEPEE